MGAKTKIEWTRGSDGSEGATWTPIRARNLKTGRIGWHCEHATTGCEFCYAEGMNLRLGTGLPFKPGHRKDIEIFLDEKMLLAPLRWKRPRAVFCCSMTDLFADFVKDEWIDKIFAVMALCPQHTFQVLTKRAERMRDYCCDPLTRARVAKAADTIAVELEIAEMGIEEIRPIAAYPGYFVSDRGRVLSSSGSARCIFCGAPVEGIATKTYCSKKCRQNACFYRRTGRPIAMQRALTEMSPDVGEQGHLRVMLYRDGEQFRESVHRLVLTAFDREPNGDEQSCHRNGHPRNNALPNLRWGDQSSNWIDRKRHSGEIAWPLPNVWKGCSCERQQEADERIPLLLQTPAAIRFISAEPLLGPLDLWNGDPDPRLGGHKATATYIGDWWPAGAPKNAPCNHGLDWVIAGGESGPGARPVHPDWIRSLRDQCVAAEIPFFFKQWGEWAPGECADAAPTRTERTAHWFNDGWSFGSVTPRVSAETHVDDAPDVYRVGKKAAGRLLDGREWNELPNPAAGSAASPQKELSL